MSTSIDSPSMLRKKYWKITIVILLYWAVSIAMVFVNKTILNLIKAPFFMICFQCLATCTLLALFRIMVGPDKPLPPKSKAILEVIKTELLIPNIRPRWTTIKTILPLSVVFVGMISFNNLSLQLVDVSFYFIVRSLTPVFNIIFTRTILKKQTSIKATLCCIGIINGFLLGVDQENISGTLSLMGVAFGISSSLFVSLNSVFVADMLVAVDNSVASLSYYNSMIAAVLLVPFMIFHKELSLVSQRYLFITEKLMSTFQFWLLMLLNGVFSLLISIVTNLQIKYTSPLTHNISGTVKACLQTVLAAYIYQESKPINWWISNAIVIGSSAMYAYVKQQDLIRKTLDFRSVGETEKEAVV